MKRIALNVAVAALLAANLTACDDDTVDVEVVEPTTFDVRIENVSTAYPLIESGVFNTPSGAAGPGPLMPGRTYQATFGAGAGQRLHFATMFVQSNDFFYSPDEDGIALYVDGEPVSGDVTGQVALWDAGTEVNQEPGAGEDQAPNQSGPDTGADDPDGTVRPAPDDHGNLPSVEDVIRVEIDALGDGRFRLRITNVSDGATLTSSAGQGPVLLAPGVFAVSAGSGVLFEAGSAEPGEGLEALAEDGNPAGLATSLAAETGLTSPFAPGVWAVHEDPGALFMAGTPASAGLEAMAEDGNPSGLAAEVAARSGVASSGAFDTPEGAAGPAPILPGEAYAFEVTAEPGDRLSFGTMLVQSNDLFVGPAETGIALFVAGAPVNGDVTDMAFLWDAGTESNQQPGVGPDQAPRQAGPDTGPAEAGVVLQVNDRWTYPAVDAMVRITVTPRSN